MLESSTLHNHWFDASANRSLTFPVTEKAQSTLGP